jgi:hypothetical protein
MHYAVPLWNLISRDTLRLRALRAIFGVSSSALRRAEQLYLDDQMEKKDDLTIHRILLLTICIGSGLEPAVILSLSIRHTIRTFFTSMDSRGVA